MKKSSTKNIEKETQACVFKIDDILEIVRKQKQKLALFKIKQEIEND